MSEISDAELQEVVQRVVRQAIGGSMVEQPVKSQISSEETQPDLEMDETQQENESSRRIAVGADHGGFVMKEDLKSYLQGKGYQVDDCGTYNTDSVDYPDFAYAVAVKVSEGKAWRGIIVDGAGIGSCMAANKVSGIRAAMCYDHATAVNSREHNGSNVLTLGAGLVGPNLARQIVQTWLDTDFAGGRHSRRVGKIMDIEKKK